MKKVLFVILSRYFFISPVNLSRNIGDAKHGKSL